MNLLSALIRSATQDTAGVSFIQSDHRTERLPYADLYRNASLILGFLQNKGLKPGDEVVIQVDNNMSFLCAFWGCILGRMIPVPLSVSNRAEQFVKLFAIWTRLRNPYLLSGEDAWAAITTWAGAADRQGENLQMSSRYLNIREAAAFPFSGHAEVINADDIAYIQFSSGSTGDPKGDRKSVV